MYPRASGGTLPIAVAVPGYSGVSPRERGNRTSIRAGMARSGCIPARAGEPSAGRPTCDCEKVYPRASGGTGAMSTASDGSAGVSPRERGNPQPPPPVSPRPGCIPARAGEPCRRSGLSFRMRVYPRASGGTNSRRRFSARTVGVSPRERGNLVEELVVTRDRRCIPARAGEPAGLIIRGSCDGVYPRASGGTCGRRFRCGLPTGVSPRERGNRLRPGGFSFSSRCIPARAGEPPRGPSCALAGRVYPRASGGTAGDRRRALVGPGVSPRERGNQRLSGATSCLSGCIPARAGEPVSGPTSSLAPEVYPRASGGTAGNGDSWGCALGVSPRERGNPNDRYASPAPARVYPRASGGTVIDLARSDPEAGVSPRERGNLRRRSGGVGDLGCIPARAGEPRRPPRAGRPTRVYPRASGGTVVPVRRSCSRPGVSPRERGNRDRRGDADIRPGCIPARAGEPEHRLVVGRIHRVYPRASGGTLRTSTWPRTKPGVSPRERGNRRIWVVGASTSGCIPARAGEPRYPTMRTATVWVYPRASGGTRQLSCVSWDESGVSPRERGNPQDAGAYHGAEGCIPARAGEPA